MDGAGWTTVDSLNIVQSALSLVLENGHACSNPLRGLIWLIKFLIQFEQSRLDLDFKKPKSSGGWRISTASKAFARVISVQITVSCYVFLGMNASIIRLIDMILLGKFL